jgi:hypothetical protein
MGSMTDGDGSAVSGAQPNGNSPVRHRLAPRVWLPALAIVVIVAVVAVIFAMRDRGSPQSVNSPSPSPSSSGAHSATHPQCKLQVLDSGFSNHYGKLYGVSTPKSEGEIQYGAVIENPCAQAAVNSIVTVVAVSSSHHSVHDTSAILASETRNISQLAPGQRTGVAGIMTNGGDYDATKVVGIRITILSNWVSVSNTSSQPPADAQQVTVGSRDKDGYVSIRFTLHIDSGLDSNWMSIIMRDGSGSIVSGEMETIEHASSSGDIVHTSAWVPQRATGLRAEIYFIHGSP